MDQINLKGSSVLVVCSETSVSHQLRGTLQELGVVDVVGVFSHSDGLARASDKKFTHIFFDCEPTDMAPLEFIEKIQEINESTGLIVVASKIDMEEVFTMLRAGARSFLLVPFTFEAVEESMKHILQEYQIREDLLEDEDLSGTLTEVMLTNFNMLCRLRSLLNSSSASHELQKMVDERQRVFRDSVELARSAGEGDAFINHIVDRCLQHAAQSNTRLNKVRQRLRKAREKKVSNEEKST